MSAANCLKGECGSVDDNIDAGNMYSSSEERRGLKRRMVEDPGRSGLIIGDVNSASADTNKDCDKPEAVQLTPGNEPAMKTKKVEQEIMEDPMTSSNDLPEGMFLEWNSDLTQAILTIVSQVSGTNPDESAVSGDRELRVCLVGRAKIRVVEGSAEILGYILKAPQNNDQNANDENKDIKSNTKESCQGNYLSGSHGGVIVTSPYWTSWMTLEADSQALPCKIVMDCVRGSETFKVTAPKRPIILANSWRACANCVVKDFCSSHPSKLSKRTTTSLMIDSLEDYEDTNRYDPNLKQHCLDANRRVCIITGAKGVGKSTMLRYLTNRILSTSSSASRSIGENDGQNDVCGIEEVAILDTDVGQPELAPPGMLSLSIVRKPLLQPPYWNLVGKMMTDDEVVGHNNEQVTSCYGPKQENGDECEAEDGNSDIEMVSLVFFGNATSKVDPTRYIDAVQFLMNKYETNIAHSNSRPIPILINMDGWVKGLGYQILSALIESLRPTHLAQILGDTPGQTFDLPSAILGGSTIDAEGEATIEQPTTMNMMYDHHLPKVYKLEACQTLSRTSLCKIPAFTTRNFRWATYFLPNELQTFDAWDFVSAKSLQTGWIVATNSDKTTSVPQWWHRKPITAVDDDNNNDITIEIGDEDDDDEKRNESELNDDCRLAQALARERPFCVPMEVLDAFVIGSDFEDYLRIPSNIGSFGDKTKSEIIDQTYRRIFQALNGCVVALCTNTQTMESLGYGILRSIDWEERLLYVLVAPSVVARTNDPSSLLSKVKALVGGSLPLPLAMLFRGICAESFPYLTTPLQVSNGDSAILGSEPMKSRNNIGRRRNSNF